MGVLAVGSMFKKRGNQNNDQPGAPREAVSETKGDEANLDNAGDRAAAGGTPKERADAEQKKVMRELGRKGAAKRWKKGEKKNETEQKS